MFHSKNSSSYNHLFSNNSNDTSNTTTTTAAAATEDEPRRTKLSQQNSTSRGFLDALNNRLSTGTNSRRRSSNGRRAQQELQQHHQQQQQQQHSSAYPKSQSHTPATSNPIADSPEKLSTQTTHTTTTRRSQTPSFRNSETPKPVTPKQVTQKSTQTFRTSARKAKPRKAKTYTQKYTNEYSTLNQMDEDQEAKIHIITTINSIDVDWSVLRPLFPSDADFSIVLRYGSRQVSDNRTPDNYDSTGLTSWHFLPPEISFSVDITVRSNESESSHGSGLNTHGSVSNEHESALILYSNSFPASTKKVIPYCEAGWPALLLTPAHRLGSWVFSCPHKWIFAWKADFKAASRPKESLYNRQQRTFLDDLYRWALFTLPHGRTEEEDTDDDFDFEIECGQTSSFGILTAGSNSTTESNNIQVSAPSNGRKLETITALANPNQRYCIDLTISDVNWGKNKRVRRYKSNFRLTMNHNYRSSMTKLIKFHKDRNNGVWFIPEFLELFCAMIEGGETSVIHPIAFELWEGEQLVAVTAGYAIGRAFHDYSMATFVRDKRGCGGTLTRVVGDVLKQAGYELWYWGFKGGYMKEYDSMGGQEFSGSEFGKRWARLIDDGADTILNGDAEPSSHVVGFGNSVATGAHTNDSLHTGDVKNTGISAGDTTDIDAVWVAGVVGSTIGPSGGLDESVLKENDAQGQSRNGAGANIEGDGLSSWQRCLRLGELVSGGRAIIMPKSENVDLDVHDVLVSGC